MSVTLDSLKAGKRKGEKWKKVTLEVEVGKRSLRAKLVVRRGRWDPNPLEVDTELFVNALEND